MIEGNIKTDGKYATSVRGVFVAGDAMTGASLVARAMRHGREACRSMSRVSGAGQLIFILSAPFSPFVLHLQPSLIIFKAEIGGVAPLKKRGASSPDQNRLCEN